MLNTWHHLAATLQDSWLLLYIDGYEVAYDTIASDIIFNTSPGYGMEIGTYLRDGANEALGGLIDEAAIFGRGLSEEEVLAIFESDDAGYCMP